MAAHAFRAWLWDVEGWTVWNAQWYGGHHVPGYSLLYAPLGGWLGPHAAVALCGVASAVALLALASLAPAQRRPAVRWLLVAAALANLVVGRGPFALGVAFGALALLGAARGRGVPAAAAALGCVAASPVAGVFLAVAAAGLWLGGALPARRAAVLAGPAALGGVALGVLFGGGGTERFVASAFWPMLALALAGAWLLPRRLRVAAVAYAALLCVAFLLPTPMGHNATRLGVLAGPALLAAAGRGPRWALVAVGAGLLHLQWLPAVRAIAESRGDPATRAEFHAPLLDFLDREAAPGDRVEVPLTRNHWEAAHVAPRWALARGWERQRDIEVNDLFYDGRTLTARRYEAWLRREGIRWVALPDAPLDFSARDEARLLASGPPFLRPAFRSAGWRVFELRSPPVFPAVIAATPSDLRLRFERPGRVVLNRRWTPYWDVVSGRAHVSRAGDLLAVEAPAPGAVRVVARFALGALP